MSAFMQFMKFLVVFAVLPILAPIATLWYPLRGVQLGCSRTIHLLGSKRTFLQPLASSCVGYGSCERREMTISTKIGLDLLVGL